MNRRIVSILIAILVLVALLAMLQSAAIAQGPGSQEGGDEAEPPVVEPTNLDALVSSAFTYQGQLKNGGAPVNGDCDFIWDIYAASAGGTALATDTDTLAVTGGLFTAVINVPTSLMDGNGRYLEVQVRCPAGAGTYTTLTPRQQLYAAPYALGLRLPFSHTISNSGSPIFAVTNNSAATGSPSFLGQSAGGDGVRGESTGAGGADNGVYGETNSTTSSEAGVKGISTSSAAGGYFSSSTGYGVYGSTGSGIDYGGYFSNSAATSGAALYANGDAKQSLAGDGFVKAGVYVNSCGTSPTIVQSFNNVNTSSITVSSGGSAGVCIVDFNFDVSARYIVATSRSSTPRFITFLPTATTDQVAFYKFDANGAAIVGDIMVLVY
jgi:hypothetical protein